MPRTFADPPKRGPHEIALSKMAPPARKRYRARVLSEYEWPDAWGIPEGSLHVDQVKFDGDKLWVFLSSPDFPCDPDGYYFVNPPLKVPNGTWREEERNGVTIEVENTAEDLDAAFRTIVSEAATYYATHPNVWGRTTLTVFSDASDGIIESGGSYSNARAGTGHTLGASNGSMQVGQLFFSPDSYIYVGYLGFDTSSIPDAATVDDATPSLFVAADESTTDFTVQARLYDWGATLTTADWVAGASVGSQTLLATLATSGLAVESYNAFTDVAFAANIDKMGTTRFLVCSSRFEAGSTPTGNEYVVFYEADTTGTTKDPKLVINYTDSSVTLTVADATHAHEADSPTLTQEHSLAVADAAHAHTADNLALTQDHTLVVADATHGHTADNLTVEEGGTDLVVDDSVHAHTADSPTLTQVHELLVADALHAHSAETIVLAGSSQISFKRSQTLPRVVHQIASPYGDDNPLVDSWEAREIAPGGYESAAGTIDAQRVLDRPDVYKFGSHWRMYDEETGECIWAGRLLDPAINGGKAQLSARGWGTIPDREAGRLLYQTYALDEWEENRFSDEEPQKWRLSQMEESLAFHRDNNLSLQEQLGPQWWFRAPGTGDVRRLRFTLNAGLASAVNQAVIVINDLAEYTINSSTDTDFDEVANYNGRSNACIRVRDAAWSELPAIELATSAAADDIIDTVTDHGFSAGDRVRFPALTGGSGLHEDTFYWVLATSLAARTFKVSRFSGGSAVNFTTDITAGRVRKLPHYAPTLLLQCTDVVINAIALGDDFSATQLIKDVCGRIGIDDSLVQDTGVNVLPLDHQEGPYSELLDYAAMLADWRWVVHDNGKGGGPVMDFGPWTTRRWTLTDERARVDLLPTERWNKLTVSYRDSQRNRPNQVTVRADPDPLPIDNNYGRVGLGQAFPDDSRPRQIAETLMDYLSKNRPAGTADIAMVRDETRQLRPAYHVRAGDVLDIPWRNVYGLRIKETTKTANGITLTFDESLAPLTSLAARKQRRLSSR